MKASDDLVAEINEVLKSYESDPAFADAMTDAEKIEAASAALNRTEPPKYDLQRPLLVGPATAFALARGGTTFPQRRTSAWSRLWSRVSNWIVG